MASSAIKWYILHMEIQWNLKFPLGHLHSGDTKFGPGKICSHNLVSFTSIEGTPLFRRHLSTQNVTDHRRVDNP